MRWSSPCQLGNLGLLTHHPKHWHQHTPRNPMSSDAFAPLRYAGELKQWCLDASKMELAKVVCGMIARGEMTHGIVPNSTASARMSSAITSST